MATADVLFHNFQLDEQFPLLGVEKRALRGRIHDLLNKFILSEGATVRKSNHGFLIIL